MIKINILIVLLLSLFQVSIVKCEENLVECEVLDDDTCILSDGSELKPGHKCVTYDGFVYKGVGDVGKCEYESYSYFYDKEYKNYVERDSNYISNDNSSNMDSPNSPNSQIDDDSQNSQFEIIDDTLCSTSQPENCNIKTYYLFKNEDGTDIENGNQLGYLYYCDSNKNCVAVNKVGYYINKKSNNNIYSCSSDDDGKCRKTSANDSCTESTISELFNENNGLSICLNYSINKVSIAIAKTNAGNYIVNYNTGNIFGITNGNQALVKVDEQSVTLDKDYDNEHYYVYAKKSDNNVVDNNQCPSGDVDSLLMELRCENAICTEIPLEQN